MKGNRMTRTLTFFGWTLAVGLLLGLALLAAAAWTAGALDHATIHINGEPLRLAQLDAGEWLLAVGGAALALLVAVLVVPVAVLVPLAIAAVALAAALVVVTGVVAMLFSPLILLLGAAWLVWRLLRRETRQAGANAGDTGATIAR